MIVWFCISGVEQLTMMESVQTPPLLSAALARALDVAAVWLICRVSCLVLDSLLKAGAGLLTFDCNAGQTAGLISYRRGAIQVLDRHSLEEASCECYAIVKERFDAFLTPPSRATTKAEAIRATRIDHSIAVRGATHREGADDEHYAPSSAPSLLPHGLGFVR